LRTLRARMESGEAIRDMPDHLKREFLGGCMFSIGIMECWRHSRTALEIADRIESFSPMYAMNADQLRSMYYSGCGDMTRAEEYRQRVETRALQVGAAWQVVTLGPIDAHLASLWSHDALLAKRAAAELERLSHELPAMRHEARRARGTYLVLTGRYAEAVATLQADDAPRSLAGWSRGQGLLARAHNRLGEHARARELCHAALAGRSEADLGFIVMNLHVQLELALADAALGEHASARERCDRLLARHTNIGLPALGALHETRARVALLAGDLETCRAQCVAMRRCYLATGIASLRELSDRLAERLASAERGDVQDAGSAELLLIDDAHLMTRMRLILTNADATFERRAQRALQLALELTGAEQGFVISDAASGGAVGLPDCRPPSELLRWARAQLDGSDVDETAMMQPEAAANEAPVLTLGDMSYSVVPLGAPAQGVQAAALTLGFRGTAPRMLEPAARAILADHLRKTQS
jgi:hypothetical protein